ncbi:MAG: hypothetical protein IPK66_05925 [Rhodospirillales bacterium]|nr:hypothetical protein [Rhodospirillales bacterium]
MTTTQKKIIAIAATGLGVWWLISVSEPSKSPSLPAASAPAGLEWDRTAHPVVPHTSVEQQLAQPRNPSGGVESKTISMTFENCQLLIRRTADQVGQAPINIVDSEILRMVRFVTSDGSVLVTCSKPDEKAMITRSPYQ